MRKTILIFGVFIIGLSAGLYFGADKIMRLYHDHLSQEEMASLYQGFADQCLENIDKTDHSTVLIELRHCLHMNSQHHIDDEFYRLAKGGNIAFARAVMDYTKGTRKTKPHMECSRRSVFLNNTYRKLGYESRIVVVVRNAEKFPDHVYVEVLNPDTDAYEVQDPKYDIYLKAVETNQKLDSKALLQMPFDSVVPCGYNDQCSWQVRAPDNRAIGETHKLFMNIAYLNEYDDGKGGPLLYNPERLDPFAKITYKDGRKVSYCDKRGHHCKNTINVTKE